VTERRSGTWHCRNTRSYNNPKREKISDTECRHMTVVGRAPLSNQTFLPMRIPMRIPRSDSHGQSIVSSTVDRSATFRGRTVIVHDSIELPTCSGPSRLMEGYRRFHGYPILIRRLVHGASIRASSTGGGSGQECMSRILGRSDSNASTLKGHFYVMRHSTLLVWPSIYTRGDAEVQSVPNLASTHQ
jgi:hypothetical protein